MTPEAWGINAAAIIAGSVAALESFRARRAATAGRREATGARAEATGARASAELAADRSEPTSNGFARETVEALKRIEAGQRQDRELLLGHIQDHARSDVSRRQP